MFIDSYILLFHAIIASFIFGFLLQKGLVANFNTIVSQFLLKDFTMMKVMMTAIVVSAIGLYAMLDFNVIPSITLRAMPMSRILMGGSLFGIGMAILGYCPGTAIVAWSEGAKDAPFGLLGMIFGGFIFSKIGSFIPSDIVGFRHSLSSYFGIGHWWLIGLLIIGLVCLAYFTRLVEER